MNATNPKGRIRFTKISPPGALGWYRVFFVYGDASILCGAGGLRWEQIGYVALDKGGRWHASVVSTGPDLAFVFRTRGDAAKQLLENWLAAREVEARTRRDEASQDA